jgi:hypothetical protein
MQKDEHISRNHPKNGISAKQSTGDLSECTWNAQIMHFQSDMQIRVNNLLVAWEVYKAKAILRVQEAGAGPNQ